MHSGVLFIGILALICSAVQLLPVISVPITSVKIKHRIELCHYKNVSYGVFGYCLTQLNTCSPTTIGYVGDVAFPYVPDEFQAGNPISIYLPSRAMQSFSKLLFVHVIAFVFTNMLLITAIICLFHEYLAFSEPKKGLATDRKKSEDASTMLPSHTQEDDDDDGARLRKLQKRRKLFHIYFDIMIVFAILSFLLSLLSFLADILLFVPYMGWIGWIQLTAVLSMALISSLVCLMKRSILSRRHLEEEVYAMGRVTDHNSDSASDLGVYIYSNGFFTANEESNDTRTRAVSLSGQT